MADKKRRVEVMIEPITKSIDDKKKKTTKSEKNVNDGIPENLYDEVSDGSDDERKIDLVEEEVIVKPKKTSTIKKSNIKPEPKKVQKVEESLIPHQLPTIPITKTEKKDEKQIVEQVVENKAQSVSQTESEVAFYREMIKQLINKPSPEIKIKPVLKKEKVSNTESTSSQKVLTRNIVPKIPQKPENPFLAFF